MSLNAQLAEMNAVLLERIAECKRLREELLRELGFQGPVIFLEGMYWLFWGLLTQSSTSGFTNNTGVFGEGTGTAQDFTDTASPLDPF